MKKLQVFVVIAALLILGSPIASAKVARVSGPWTLNAPSTITFMCGAGSYSHTLLTVSQDADGDFTGTGHYNPNNGYTWDVEGDIAGDAISFTIVYTGINAGYTLNGAGTIGSDGSITGTVDGNCQSFSMSAETADRFMGNHGQYVRSQADKQTAAQSRVGMPIQSKGHAK